MSAASNLPKRVWDRDGDVWVHWQDGIYTLPGQHLDVEELQRTYGPLYLDSDLAQEWGTNPCRHECSCAMTEASQNYCAVHGLDGTLDTCPGCR